MRPKLIATDLDGTLLRSDGTISSRTLAALRMAEQQGVHVVVATARPFRALRPVIDETPLGGWGVCQNGAVVYELSGLAPVLKWELAHEVAHRIVADLRDMAAGMTFAWEAEDLFGCEPGFNPAFQAMQPPHVTRGDALALISAPLTKLLAHHPSMSSPDLAVIAAPVVGARALVTHSGAPFLEISAAGVSKAHGVGALCDRLGVTAAEVIAFGDAVNDQAMLEWAGHGVAMANAHADVRAAADEIAPSNDDDGVAAIIERLLGA